MTTRTTTGGPAATPTVSTADLVNHAAARSARLLVPEQLSLANIELAAKTKPAGIGGGLLRGQQYLAPAAWADLCRCGGGVGSDVATVVGRAIGPAIGLWMRRHA